jgi:succinyl-diaminopimelate desuccinylase
MNTQKILKELVEIESITKDTKCCKKAIEYIQDIAKENNLKTKILQKNNVYCLLISKQIKKKYKVLLNGHLDVVPGNKGMFKAKVKGNRMYGRGTSDMKGVDIAMLLAYIQIVQEGLGDDTLLLFTTDEEYGGFNGMANFISQGYTADICFIPDGGNKWSVCTDEKGVFHIKIKAQGKGAHGSRPWTGENAVLKLITVYQNIQKEFKKKWGLPSKDDNWKPTCNLGSLNGGDAANKVPNLAEMQLDIRYPSPVTQKEIEDIVDNSLIDGVSYEVLSTGLPLSTDVNNPYVRKWIEVTKKDIEYEKAHGASDGRFLSEKNIPVILTKPISSEPHIDNEWIDLKDLEVFREKMVEWLKTVS